MKDRFILTPFFLDQELPQLIELRTSEWAINRPGVGNGDALQRMSELHRPLADLVYKSIQEGERPVCLAGDCCATIGTMAGMQRAGWDPTLLWFDAHGDFNTWETSPSGFLGGMPLAMLVGRGEQRLIQAVNLNPLEEDKVVLTDARDLDPGEREALKASKIRHIEPVTDLLRSPLPDGPLYVHFDTDVLRPEDAPAMNYLAAGGPTADELRSVFRFLSETKRVIGVSLSSWNPEMDGEVQTKELCMDLFRVLIR